MSPVQTAASPRWYTSRTFQRSVIVIGVVIVLVQGCLAVFKRENDFNCHLAYGANFIAGEPYVVPNWYPIGRVMFNAIPAAMNYYVARGVFYVAALAALAASLWFWSRMIAAHYPLDRKRRFAAVALACGLMLAFLLRDLDECGLQLLLLFCLSAGAYAMFRGRKLQSGCWLAAAATYKATPLLFLPFLLWKRQWRAAGSMAAFAVLFNVLPALHLGWDGMLEANRTFFERSQYTMAHMPDAYPSIPVYEAPKHQNLALAALFARYLETYEPGHSLYLEHRAFAQFGNLPVDQAKLAVRLLTLALGAAIALAFRRSWQSSDGQRRLIHEWGVACIFCALLSPLCWKQHLVVGLPCVLLVGRQMLAAQRMPRWRIAAVAAIAAVWLLSRHGVVGREFSIVLLSYKLDTIALLGMAMLSTLPPRQAISTAQQTKPTQRSAEAATRLRAA